MPLTYEPADAKTRQLVTNTMARFHPCLAHVEARVGALMIWDYDKEGCARAEALKLKGYPCAAVVKINSLRDRVQGLPDATITIDAEHWARTDAETRAAIIDHELEHLQVKGDGGDVLYWDDVARAVVGGFPVSDAHGRPKLVMKLHDWQLGGFDSIVKRHGAYALEVVAARMHLDPESSQYRWDFAKEVSKP
ncbi:MAG: putative metallopeptidase [Planctomycetota bacterium]